MCVHNMALLWAASRQAAVVVGLPPGNTPRFNLICHFSGNPERNFVVYLRLLSHLYVYSFILFPCFSLDSRLQSLLRQLHSLLGNKASKCADTFCLFLISALSFLFLYFYQEIRLLSRDQYYHHPHQPAMDPPETPENALRIWYTHLWAPKVDLIGDIAGKEPFIIHGESLIRHCLEESPANFQGE